MKSILKPLLFFLLITLQISCASEPSFIGLWEIEKVSMGDRTMTPVAKWAKYNTDGTYESGNGWLKSIDGTWSFNDETKQITSFDLLGIKDEMGGFAVSFSDQKMIWKREEFGNMVQVTFKRIEKLPLSTADYLEGVWVLNGETKEKLHFRWDRIINFYNSENQKTSGYWHINGHRPEITVLPHTQGKEVEGWMIDVNEKELKMTGVSDTNKGAVKIYTRTNKL